MTNVEKQQASDPTHDRGTRKRSVARWLLGIAVISALIGSLLGGAVFLVEWRRFDEAAMTTAPATAAFNGAETRLQAAH
jgi:CHASE2 domain-containing sensor protein